MDGTDGTDGMPKAVAPEKAWQLAGHFSNLNKLFLFYEN